MKDDKKKAEAAPVKAGNIAKRLEYLRGELRAERISYGELAELQSLAKHIQPGDIELLEVAGIPENSASAQVAGDTPTPLIVCEPYTNRNVFPIGYVRADGATVIVAEVNGAGGTEAENRRHATFIVRACNAHAELVEALRQIADWVGPAAVARRSIQDIARAAIAKAERGQA